MEILQITAWINALLESHKEGNPRVGEFYTVDALAAHGVASWSGTRYTLYVEQPELGELPPIYIHDGVIDDILYGKEAAPAEVIKMVRYFSKLCTGVL